MKSSSLSRACDALERRLLGGSEQHPVRERLIGLLALYTLSSCLIRFVAVNEGNEVTA